MNMEPRTFKIIRHKNPKGKTTWYRAVYCDEHCRVHKSLTYHGNLAAARRKAQNWLYAQIHIWCTTAHIEQRVISPDGTSSIIPVGQEEII